MDVNFSINGEEQTLELNEQQAAEWDAEMVATACAEAFNDENPDPVFKGEVVISSPESLAGTYTFDLAQ